MSAYAVPMRRAGLPPFVVLVELPADLNPALGDPGNVSSIVAGWLASTQSAIPGGVPAGPGEPVRDGALLNAYYWQALPREVNAALGLQGAELRRRAAEREPGRLLPDPEHWRDATTDEDDTPVVDHGYHDEYVPGCPLCDRTAGRGQR